MNTWIKMRSNLEMVAEFIAMQRILQIDPMTLTGALFRFWNFIDQNSRNGEVPCECEDIDRMTLKGFAAALLEAGWLERNEDGLQIPNFLRYSQCGSKRRQATGQSRRSASPKRSLPRGANGRFVPSKPAGNDAASDGETTVNGGATATVNGAAAATVHGESQLIEKRRVAPQTPSREEKNREEKNREGGKRYPDGGGDDAAGGPPSFHFSREEFGAIALRCGLPEDRAARAFADLASRDFCDRHGKPVKDLAKYLERCAGNRNVVPFSAPPPAKQLWQIEADLKRVEDRLKREADHYKPDPALIKALKIQRERFKQELIAFVQPQPQATHAHAA